MARFFANIRFGVLILAIAIALVLWGMAHGASPIERPYDVPVELYDLQEALVVTDLSSDAINVRIAGSRAALRNVDPGKLVYRLPVSGAKTGTAEYEVDTSQIEEQLPSGAQIVSRSPSNLQVRFERRGRKAVGVRADVEGEPAEGFLLAGVQVTPRRVWLAGARSQVLRLSEVVTEPIDIAGLDKSEEREVRLFLGAGTVWMEENKPVNVRIDVEPDPALLEEKEAAEGEEAAAQ